MAPIDHAALAARAEQQLGLVSMRDRAELRLTKRQVDGLVGAGILRRVTAGVCAMSASTSSPQQRLLAATMAAGDGAVVSHLAAAWVLGFDGVRPNGIDVTIPRGRNPRVQGATVHRVRDLLAVDVMQRGPIPITTPARTLLDIADLVPPAVLEEACDGARRRGQIYLPFLRWRLEQLRRRGRPGARALDALLQKDLTSDRAESWLESAFLRLIRDAFLPPPRIQVVKLTSSGRIRLDAFYDDQRLVAEVGGHVWHSTRRQRQRDAERRSCLVAEGLRVVDFTYEDVTERPAHVATTLARLLGIEAWAA